MTGPTTGPTTGQTQPLLRVVNADATPEEIAAIVAVFAAIGTAAAAPARTTPRSEWASPARAVRRPLSAGPGGWRASGLPH